MTPGMNATPCQVTLNQASDQTKMTATLNQLQTFIEQTAYKDLGKNTIYTTAGIIYVFNTINTKRMTVQLPLKPFEFDFNLSYTYQSEGIKYTLNW